MGGASTRVLIAGTLVVFGVSLAGTVRAEPAVQRALASLAKADSPRVRAQAIRVLRPSVGDVQVRRAVLGALGDPAPIVRAAAAMALGSVEAALSYSSVADAARDSDPMVARWGEWAVRMALGSAATLNIKVRGLAATPGPLQDQLTRSYQQGVLEVLLGSGRFDVAGMIDFHDDYGATDEPSGQVRGAAGMVLDATLEGEIRVDGDGLAAVAEGTMRVVTPGGFVAYDLGVREGGRQGPTPPLPPDADEYTIPPEPEDARIAAATAAGAAAGNMLLEALRTGAPMPGETGKQVRSGRASRGRRGAP